jgi:hypothetical protein
VKSHPLTKLWAILGHDINELDNNPKIQLKIHTVGFWYWTINFPLIAYMFFFMPTVWLKWGLFITLIYSIYANWTSDYTGMSSSQAVINTTNVEIKGSNVTVNIDD